jgi:PhnB protein
MISPLFAVRVVAYDPVFSNRRSTMAVSPIPPGHHTVHASLTVHDGTQAIEFYRKSLGAEEINCIRGPNGKIMHAELKIGGSIIFLNDESPEMMCKSPRAFGGSPVSFYLYFENVESAWKRATDAGGKVLYPLTDMFWGDRVGGIEDPFGYKWSIAQHVRDVTPDEMKKGQEEFSKRMGGNK